MDSHPRVSRKAAQKISRYPHRNGTRTTSRSRLRKAQDHPVSAESEPLRRVLKEFKTRAEKGHPTTTTDKLDKFEKEQLELLQAQRTHMDTIQGTMETMKTIVTDLAKIRQDQNRYLEDNSQVRETPLRTTSLKKGATAPLGIVSAMSMRTIWRIL